MLSREFFGSFAGLGRWTDITGESRSYRIVYLQFEADDDAIVLRFFHDLHEEDDEVIAEFRFDFRDEHAFSVSSIAGEQRQSLGSGHAFRDFCQYCLVIGDMMVENRLVLYEGRLHVFGSSSRNQQGRFIHWEEVLEPDLLA